MDTPNRTLGRVGRPVSALALVGFLCVLSLCAGVYLASAFKRVEASYIALLRSTSDVHQGLQNLALELSAQHRAYLNLIITVNDAERELLLESVGNAQASANSSLLHLKNTEFADVRSEVEQWEQTYGRYCNTGARLIGIVNAGERDAAIEFRAKELRPLYADLSSRLATAGATVTRSSQTSMTEISSQGSNLRTFLLAVLGWPALVLALAFFVVAFLLWSVLRGSSADASWAKV